MSTEEIFYGDHFANSYNGAGTGLTSIPRTGIAAGTANEIVVNGAGGLLTSTPILDAARGGTGINSSASTGVAKVSAGTWSVSAIVNADIASGAAIARSKLAAGAAGYVLINSPAGLVSEEQFLSTARGGTGQDLSGVGSGPFILTNSSGTISSTLQYATAATANTLVQRDISGGITGAASTFTSVSTATLTSAGDITISPVGGDVFLGTNILHMTPTAIAGGDTSWYVNNAQTIGAVSANVIIFPTVSKTSYQFDVVFAAGDTGSTDAAAFSFKVRAKNNTGTLTLGAILLKTSSTDAGLATADATASTSGTNVVFQVTGVVGLTINWVARVAVAQQTY
jgi:hypothetical protein